MDVPTSSVMAAAFFLLFTAGLAGTADQIYFHIHTFKLHKREGTFWEHVTHVGRDIGYLLLFVLMNARATGRWWWLYPSVAGFHFASAMIDSMIEPRTRRPLGGIPAGEYRLHAFILFTEGLAIGVLLWGSHGNRALGDALAWSPLQLPSLLGVVPRGALALAAGFLIHDFAFMCRMAALKLMPHRGRAAVST